MVGYSKLDQVGKSKTKNKKVKEWDEKRKDEKELFEEVGITSCEFKLKGICMPNFALGFAHEYKRKDLPPGQINRVALACGACHEQIEYHMTKQEMYETVHDVIESRPEHINQILLGSQ
jgi:hypothetical protein